MEDNKYKMLSENMLNGFAYCKMIYDDKGKAIDFIYLQVNKKFTDLTGLKDVIGKPVSEVVPGFRETNPDLFDIYERVSLTGNSEKIEIFVKALSMWFSISVYSIEKGTFIAVFDVIDESKKAEEDLQKKNEELEKFNKILIEREIKMIEMKVKMKNLEEKLKKHGIQE